MGAAVLAASMLNPVPAFSSPVVLSDILNIDPLGYACVPSRYFDEGEDGAAAIAFVLSGKTRLPRTCLPEPCARALTRQELSALTGTETILARFHNEWEDYYARYADHCRKETNWYKPGSPPVVAGPPSDFWEPIIDQSRRIRRGDPPQTSSVMTPLVGPPRLPPLSPPRPPSSLVPPESPPNMSMQTSSSGSGGQAPPPTPPTPAPIPLPPAGILLATVLGAVLLRKRQARSAA